MEMLQVILGVDRADSVNLVQSLLSLLNDQLGYHIVIRNLLSPH